jgi:hypothetical protein
MAKCNFCTYRTIKRYKKPDTRLIVKPDRDYGGVNVYEVCPGEPINHKKDFRAWFAELPKSCMC